MTNYRIFYLLLGLLFFYCGVKEQEPLKSQQTNQIVLIFDHAPINRKYTFENGISTGNGGSYEIFYIDDYGLPRFESLIYGQYDTIIIKSQRKNVEITHAYKGIDKLSYLFQNGDSVLFRYNGLKPWATILNRKTSEVALNYDIRQREFICGDDFPEKEKYFNPFYFYGFKFKPKRILEEVDRVQRLALKSAKLNFIKEMSYLDLLNKSGLLSQEEVKYIKTKTFASQKIIELQQKIGFRPLSPLQIDLSIADFKLNDEFLLTSEKQYITESILNSDSNLYFSFHNELLDWLLNSYYSRKVGRSKSLISQNGIQTSGSNLPDYMALYDTILHSDLIGGRAKKLLLLKNLELLIPQSSVDQIEKYFKKFMQDTEDSAMIRYLKVKYRLNYMNKIEKKHGESVSDLFLISINGKEISFSEVLDELKGNLVYVDFWSSGCAPCIKEMPYSKKLHEVYKGRNMVFVYLSMDPNRDKWMEANLKFGLEKYRHNYLIANQYTSKQLEELNVAYIPRYMIYDKNGNLIQNFAPRPSEKKLNNLLDKYLAE